MGSQLPIFVDTAKSSERSHISSQKLEDDRHPFKGGFQVAFRIANNGGETETYSDNNARNWIVR